MTWQIMFLPEAEDDLASLNRSVQSEVLKVIRKVAQNPGYPNGYGKPLETSQVAIWRDFTKSSSKRLACEWCTPCKSKKTQ